jgi:CRP-like cAMP-binding protein
VYAEGDEATDAFIVLSGEFGIYKNLEVGDMRSQFEVERDALQAE